MTARRKSFGDELIGAVDAVLREAFPSQMLSGAPYSTTPSEQGMLSDADRACSAALMRVNHAGEVSAQALYRGQAITARDPALQDGLLESATEETAHLDWCRQRLAELGDRPSRLDPIWYLGSYLTGMVAGAAGDRWNLGFLAETEHQVVEHLDRHLRRLPAADLTSRAIVTKMREDEAGHEAKALASGAAQLPGVVKMAMRLQARIMTTLAYRI